LHQANIDSESIAIVEDNVMQLIGYFNIDPNRALDIILDAYENNLDNPNYLRLLSKFKSSSVSNILGFKYQRYVTDTAP